MSWATTPSTWCSRPMAPRRSMRTPRALPEAVRDRAGRHRPVRADAAGHAFRRLPSGPVLDRMAAGRDPGAAHAGARRQGDMSAVPCGLTGPITARPARSSRGEPEEAAASTGPVARSCHCTRTRAPLRAQSRHAGDGLAAGRGHGGRGTSGPTTGCTLALSGPGAPDRVPPMPREPLSAARTAHSAAGWSRNPSGRIGAYP